MSATTSNTFTRSARYMASPDSTGDELMNDAYLFSKGVGDLIAHIASSLMEPDSELANDNVLTARLAYVAHHLNDLALYAASEGHGRLARERQSTKGESRG